MLIWIIFAIMTVAVLIALFSPILRRQPDQQAANFDLAVYQDQLTELDRDTAAGLIGAKEAEAAGNEVRRRILAANQAAKKNAQAVADPRLAKRAMFASIIIIPLISMLVYLPLGHPQMPDVPLQWRLEKAMKNHDLPAMVFQVERHLKKNPDDLKGWKLLGPSLIGMKRFNDAANAFANALRLAPNDAKMASELGEALLEAGRGKFSPESVNAFLQAEKIDKTNAKAQFYLALNDAENGKMAAAITRWKKMLASGPADAFWRKEVENQVARAMQLEKAPAASNATSSANSSVDPSVPGPDAADIAAASSMTSDDRQAMIASMVERLQTRLDENGDDLDGWLRLLRARSVLGQMDKAKTALKTARQAFANNTPALQKLAAAAQELGLSE